MEKAGLSLAVIGGIAAIVALVKFMIIGYYPDEVPLFGTIGLVGLGLSYLGSRMFTTARQGG